MELILLIVLIVINIFGFIYSGRKANKALPQAPQPKAITPEPASAHMLMKTWIEMDGDGVIAGWRAKCSCGAISYATDATKRTSTKNATLGTEENVIKHFESHAKNFNRVNGNVWKDRHDELQRKFDDAQEKCYCKETQTVALLPLRG